MDERLINSIVKGFAYAENRGAPDIEHPVAGKTGEMKSIYQFTPDTWNAESMKYFGKKVPISPDAETYVMQHRVADWIKKGYNVDQMASAHNAGEGEPNAYTGKFSSGKSSVGMNEKYGVKFDVPSYAKKVKEYANQFYDSQEQPQVAVQPSQVGNGSLMGSSKGNLPARKAPLVASGGLLRGQFGQGKPNQKG